MLANAHGGPAVPRDGTLLGALFESLVTLSVRVYAQANEARVSHLRTRGGEHEIDLIIERADRRVVALEVKLKRTVDDNDVRHLKWLQERIGVDLLDAAVITTGTDAYRRKDSIAVIPAALFISLPGTPDQLGASVPADSKKVTCHQIVQQSLTTSNMCVSQTDTFNGSSDLSGVEVLG